MTKESGEDSGDLGVDRNPLNQPKYYLVSRRRLGRSNFWVRLVTTYLTEERPPRKEASEIVIRTASMKHICNIFVR